LAASCEIDVEYFDSQPVRRQQVTIAEALQMPLDLKKGPD